MKKILALLLVAAFMLSFAACTANNDEELEELKDKIEELEKQLNEKEDEEDIEGDTEGVATVGTTAEPASTQAPVYTELATTAAMTEPAVIEPEYPDFDGKEFRILSAGNVACNDFDYYESSGTTLEMAQYERLTTVEEMYNVDIATDIETGYSSATTGPAGPGYKAVNMQVASGTYNYDLCLIAGYDVAQLATIGYLYDMNSIPQIDLGASYWDQNAVNDLSIDGVTFYTTGDITVSDNNAAHCIMFNKKLAADYAIEDLYELVNEGEWTFEKLAALSKCVGEDLNQDGTYNENDRYGMLVWDDSITAVVNAAGQRCCTVNDRGEIELTFFNETTLGALDEFAEIAYDNTQAFRYNRVTTNPSSIWNNNQGLFLTTTIGDIAEYRKAESDFGILPYPKSSVSQRSYYTTLSAYRSQFVCVPLVVYDIEFIGTITEALASMGEKNITPALYDTLLWGDYVRDAESAEMLDIIFDNMVYDIGYYYQVGPYYKQLILMLREANSYWNGMYESYKPAAEDLLESINEANANAIAMWK